MARIHGRKFKTLFKEVSLFIAAIMNKFNEDKKPVDVLWIIENVFIDVPGFAYVKHYFDWAKPESSEKSSILYVYGFVNNLKKKGYILPEITFPFEKDEFFQYLYNQDVVEYKTQEAENEFGVQINTNIKKKFSAYEDSGFITNNSNNKDVDLQIDIEALKNFDVDSVIDVQGIQDALDQMKAREDFHQRNPATNSNEIIFVTSPKWKRSAAKYNKKFRENGTITNHKKPKKKLASNEKTFLSIKESIPQIFILEKNDLSKIMYRVDKFKKFTKNMKLSSFVKVLNKDNTPGRDYSTILLWYMKTFHMDMTWEDLLVVLKNNPQEKKIVKEVPAVVQVKQTVLPVVKVQLDDAEITKEKIREKLADKLRQDLNYKVTNMWFEFIKVMKNYHVFNVNIQGKTLFLVGNEDCLLGYYLDIDSVHDAINNDVEPRHEFV
jgi:hypothetical protein